MAVYDNLIDAVHRHCRAMYRYYDVRRRKMGLTTSTTTIPTCRSSPTCRRRHTWDEAVKVVLAALEPLGSEYCGALEKGLSGRWCDRYENRDKQSGAFSPARSTATRTSS